ncbi:MAG: hypothetical protein J0M10_00470 [Chitinophagales bacterium]|nr:hypothetical protein [Chitinophagales bacterium]
MKKLLPLVFILIAGTVNGQSLKDLLFSGKMKNDSNTVHRKGEDLKDKVDTTTKKPDPAPVVSQVAVTPVPGTAGKDSVLAKAPEAVAVDSVNAADPAPPVAAPATVSVARDNNRLWKEFVDTVISTIKTESLQNKKVKKGDYTVMIDYTINTDGSVTVGNIYVSPESDFLQLQLKERLNIDTPKLNPVMSSSGTARKTNRRYTVVITK